MRTHLNGSNTLAGKTSSLLFTATSLLCQKGSLGKMFLVAIASLLFPAVPSLLPQGYLQITFLFSDCVIWIRDLTATGAKGQHALGVVGRELCHRLLVTQERAWYEMHRILLFLMAAAFLLPPFSSSPLALNQQLLPDRSYTCRAFWLPQNSRILLSARIQQKANIEMQSSWTARISGKCLTISREQHRNIPPWPRVIRQIWLYIVKVTAQMIWRRLE